MSTPHGASKNGHPIPTQSGIGFEDGAPVAIHTFDYDAQDAQFINEQREIGRREAILDRYGPLLAAGLDQICQDSNPKLAAECYLYAAGMTDISEVEIARRHRVTKAAVSKRVKQWQKSGMLPPSASMRSDKACETFKKATKKSWKKRAKKNQQNSQEKPVTMLRLLTKPGLAT